MHIINLTEDLAPLYFVCLEDWSDEMKEASDHKACWYNEMNDKGLRVKLAVDDEGQIGGMIEYMPIEYAFAEGQGLYFINCIWVHGHKTGRGNFQKRGMGKALLRAAEDDARSLGAKGMAAWGISLPFWMRASWFKKHGYQKVDSNRGIILLWKAFADDAASPRWIKKKYTPVCTPGKVNVTAFLHGQCPAMNMVYQRARRAALECGEGVDFQTIHTTGKEAMRLYGEKDAVFIDAKRLRMGPPPSYAKILKKIGRRTRRISSP